MMPHCLGLREEGAFVDPHDGSQNRPGVDTGWLYVGAYV